MNRWLLSLLSRLGPGPKPPKLESLNINEILFSTPTLEDAGPRIEPIDEAGDTMEFSIHEDQWRQVELHPASRLDEIRDLLREFRVFEAEHRTPQGWRKIFLRRVPANAGSGLSLADLVAELGSRSSPGPILSSTEGPLGRVSEGFTVPLGGKCHLFGLVDAGSVAVLAADVGAGGSHQVLTDAFVRIHNRFGWILVDWVAGMVLTGVTENGDVGFWKPGAAG